MNAAAAIVPDVDTLFHITHHDAMPACDYCPPLMYCCLIRGASGDQSQGLGRAPVLDLRHLWRPPPPPWSGLTYLLTRPAGE
ncbi:hypothetical protein J6590_097304 [Homalodisca vitripennis]|nr:hypothetical protein J6590_097304 [Homalodisca vitripennis]